MYLPEKLAAQYPTEDAYRAALRQCHREVPDQEEKPYSYADLRKYRDNSAWWPCPCNLPWWGFRRGDYHLCIRPEDGAWLVYEPCDPNRKATQERKVRDLKEKQERTSAKGFD